MNYTSPVTSSTNDPVTEFVILLVATLIGTGVGFGLALWLDRIKKNQNLKEIQKNMLDGIIEELQDIHEGFTNPENVKRRMTWKGIPVGFEGGYYTVTIPSLESAINSGNFSLLPPSLQSDISKCYNKIIDCKESTKRMIGFYSTSVYTTNLADVEANKIWNHLNLNLEEAIKAINETIPKIKSAKI